MSAGVGALSSSSSASCLGIYRNSYTKRAEDTASDKLKRQTAHAVNQPNDRKTYFAIAHKVEASAPGNSKASKNLFFESLLS
ncbi:MAG: hypothetical protein KR126chlam2_00251 [Chlamydiae bacterium]|nr:hypothetical protein [Chlamydiota bacterium]